MSFRRFGGDVYKRIITLQTPETENYNIHVSALNDNAYNIEVYTASGELLGAFKETSAVMEGTTSLRTSFPTKQSKSTVFSHFDQHGTAIAGTERLHIFHEGHKFVFTLPSPTWLLSLEEDAKRATQGGMRAPMPSVVVDVKVKAGDTVKKGQAVVVLESMKTETVLRAETDGVVKSVACAKGDRVEEGTELALIEAN
jgi:3-methylcrotonyl-CoA carboxylase alpha subunit